MASTPRTRARAQTLSDITRIGREHLAADGAAALSLRAVARDLGVVSSAVYRYVSSRDELLTLLVVDAYSELGDEVDAAVDAADGPADKFRALSRAVRRWGLREPARYALLFGSPVPGYHAPAEQTTGPGTRVITTLVAVLQSAWDIRRPDIESAPTELASLHASFEDIRAQMDMDLPDELIALGVMVWASLFGAINFDVFDQYGATTFADRDALFEFQLGILTKIAGLE
ncbi:WHG domain-containing protein [Rhodococcus fascians]|jgi:AcrR family transcriptional regulator|nr:MULTISPECIES: TetR/AcrR family transcriptional regulator [Rhodococcus]KJV02273.1 tetr family transcriptional regulator [Rhodococcus sp. PML026]MBJ7325639.1 WHG domain-containing protein [Rhodococcus sp. (in: high G+C Gram-positive bacteria)]MBW4779914.1 TetR/AcrR family transcriptional regulator [Rhodococcus fascians]MBX5333562.1 WHG domain-containing protein [Rhodococcus fascians]MBY3795161.1 WHG domain-containing protein [Rhodococcus fascians]